jgi:MATE family multidrug resistance protein
LGWIQSQGRIWRLAGPVILANATTPLLGAVDTAVVGRLPDPALIGGVAVGAVVFNFIFWGFSFLRMGTTGFTAQAWGAGDPAELRGTFLRALATALALGALVILLQSPIRAAALGLAGGSAAVRGAAGIYFDLRIWSAPAALANYAVLGWLLGTRRTATALVLQLLINSLNILLAVVLTLGLGWGIRGVAAATLISEWSAAALGLTLVFRILPRVAVPQIFQRARLLRLLKVNGDIMLRTLCLQAAFFAFTLAGARLGDIPLAANAILLNLLTITAFGLDGFAMAAEILVGSAVGRHDRGLFRAAVRDAILWGAGLAALASLCFLAAGGRIVDLFTVHEEVRAAARHYLPWLALAPVIAVWCYLLDGIYIGATRTAEMRNGLVIALAGNLAAMAIALPRWENDGLWLTLMVFFILRAATLAVWLPRIDRSLAPEPARPSSVRPSPQPEA